MENTQKLVLDRAVKLLDALKLDYVIVVNETERIVRGNIELTEKKLRKRRPMDNPRGTFTGLLKDNGFKDMQVGDVITINSGDFSVESLRSTASSKAGRIWENGKIVTSVKDNELEIMRIE